MVKDQPANAGDTKDAGLIPGSGEPWPASFPCHSHTPLVLECPIFYLLTDMAVSFLWNQRGIYYRMHCRTVDWFRVAEGINLN